MCAATGARRVCDIAATGARQVCDVAATAFHTAGSQSRADAREMGRYHGQERDDPMMAEGGKAGECQTWVYNRKRVE